MSNVIDHLGDKKMTKRGKSYTAEFKTKVVLELLEGEMTLNQISSKYEVTPKSLKEWHKTFLTNASLAFDKSKAKAKIHRNKYK